MPLLSLFIHDQVQSVLVKKQPGFEASFDAHAAPTCAPILFLELSLAVFLLLSFGVWLALLAPHDADLTRRTHVFCMLEGLGSLESFTVLKSNINSRHFAVSLKFYGIRSLLDRFIPVSTANEKSMYQSGITSSTKSPLYQFQLCMCQQGRRNRSGRSCGRRTNNFAETKNTSVSLDDCLSLWWGLQLLSVE